MYDPPFTFVTAWGSALALAGWRAESRHRKQHVTWDTSRNQWKVGDTCQ